MSDTQQKAQQYFDAYAATLNAGDLDAWVDTLAREVVLNPPDREAVIGSEAARSYGQEAWFGPFSMRHAVVVQEAIPASDEYVHARGTWTIDLTPKDGSEPSSLRGTFMWLLRNEGGELKGARAAFSILD